MRRTLTAVGLCAALAFVGAAQQPPRVRVWQGTIQLPTYQEGPANPNPPFDLFTVGRFNYPYPLRDALTDRREAVTWRALHLENEYLRLTVLPDLGGHIYSCLDKRTGRDMFYANTSIKKALIGYRGAWAAFGVEFNFPVSHNWMSMSPVDFATVQNDDGSGSIWVGNSDQVYRMRWRVELRLQPATTALQQRVELYNSSDVRHRYYWWTNGAVQAWDDSRLVYPTELMATHGFTSIEPWPIDRKGRDLSVIRNQTDGPVSLFTYGTREPWVGVYHPHTNSGTVHVADPAELPAHKVWSWGYDRDAATWREALSDDDSAYVELQAGLFRNQETYAFLEPQESVRFTEYWLPVRDLGGITRANMNAVVHLERPTPAAVRVAIDVTRPVPDAHLTIRQSTTTLVDTRATLSPQTAWTVDLSNVASGPVEFDVRDGSGNPVIAYKERVLDLTPAAQVRTGPQTNVRPSRAAARSADQFVEAGTLDELEGRRLSAMETYRAGLRQFPDSVALLKAAGRLAVALGWGEAAIAAPADSDPTEGPVEWLQRARAQNTTDFEVEYYLGVALAAAGRAEARQHLDAARRFRAFRPAAAMQDTSLEGLQRALADVPRASALGVREVTLLRTSQRREEALARARYWKSVDPTDSTLRYELTLLGESDPDLWTHLAADANRVLDVAEHYLKVGAPGDALALLEREYPAVPSPMREPGSVAPRDSPLAAYYRGVARAAIRGPLAGDYVAARKLSPAYVFPNRRSSYRALASAIRSDADDHLARFLLGSLFLSSGLVEPAIDEWQRVRAAKAAIPTLHRNLGLALLHGKGEITETRAVLEEGTTADPENVEVYLTLDGVLSASDARPLERVAALRRFPSLERSPSSMVFKLALALAESGQADEAERLFHDRFFAREEGGTNVRAVYAQVRLTSARLAAEGKDCRGALGILDALPAERQDLPFTRGTMADALQPAAMVRQLAAIESQCGRAASARTRWERLAAPLESGGAPLAVAIADAARARLATPRTAAQRQRLDTALASVTATLESGGSSNPGTLECARGMLLAAVGRSKEARQSLQRVFVSPDRNLSHAMARAALRELRAQ
jgi:tetratricopeptide (TPR) repeat protein